MGGGAPPRPMRVSFTNNRRPPRPHRLGSNPSHHRPGQPSRQMVLCQQPPVVPHMLHHPPTVLRQPLCKLVSGQRRRPFRRSELPKLPRNPAPGNWRLRVDSGGVAHSEAVLMVSKRTLENELGRLPRPCSGPCRHSGTGHHNYPMLAFSRTWGQAVPRQSDQHPACRQQGP